MGTEPIALRSACLDDAVKDATRELEGGIGQETVACGFSVRMN